jgi:hypothetical protein
MTPSSHNDFKLFEGELLDPDILVQHCPLDYGRHVLRPVAYLGQLNLPIEILHRILSYVDMESLLTFRRINNRSTEVVDAMPGWKKAMDNASGVVRMAVGIKTAHRFTLPYLIQRLERKKCCLCGRPAPYFSVFSLTHHCLGPGVSCGKKLFPPLTKKMLESSDKIYGHDLETLQMDRYSSFSAIPGHYRNGETISTREVYYTAAEAGSHTTLSMCHLQGWHVAFQEIVKDWGPRGDRFTFTRTLAASPLVNIDAALTLTMVVAPWLKAKSAEVEQLYSCRRCKDVRAKWSIEFYTQEALEEHIKYKH